MKPVIRPLAAIAFALLAACSSQTYSTWTRVYDPPRQSSMKSKPTRVVKVTADSFGCIRDMVPVRGFYVDNLLGDVADTLAAANHPYGGKWPPGSVVMRIPTEAMVKHGKGFNPATNDWEFFDLTVKGDATRIRARGFTNVINQFGGNCLTCHSGAEPRWDMICESDHGCESNRIPTVMARAIQNSDPRCPKVSLPPDQKAALQQFDAMRAAARGGGAVQASR
ncbi:MAG TPA: hypothetical protein VFV70_02795 [Hyphomonadaceae bacterium]|nr:hypothetical protein [Hyphomonadaceae bacterium]